MGGEEGKMRSEGLPCMTKGWPWLLPSEKGHSPHYATATAISQGSRGSFLPLPLRDNCWWRPRLLLVLEILHHPSLVFLKPAYTHINSLLVKFSWITPLESAFYFLLPSLIPLRWCYSEWSNEANCKGQWRVSERQCRGQPSYFCTYQPLAPISQGMHTLKGEVGNKPGL